MTKQCGCGYWFSYSPMNEVRANVASGCISLFPPSVKFSNWCKSTISLTIVPLKLFLRRLCRVVLRVSVSSSSCAMVLVLVTLCPVSRLLPPTDRDDDWCSPRLHHHTPHTAPRCSRGYTGQVTSLLLRSHGSFSASERTPKSLPVYGQFLFLN